MQGIYIHGRRPASKKAVREAVLSDPASVRIEGTSMMGNDYDGPLPEWDGRGSIYFVGPDPYTKRNFYGTIDRVSGGFKVK